MKTCTVCNNIKDIKDFYQYVLQGVPGARFNSCISCVLGYDKLNDVYNEEAEGTRHD